jgi:hypothetical protein
LASKQMSVREAILRLLPGITPEVFYQALEADLHNTDTTAESRLFQEEIEQVYGSQIWKTSVILNRIYRKMPRWLQQPARECAKWFYHRV